MQLNQWIDFMRTPAGGAAFVILMAWTLYWKGRALWTAARGGEKGWFIALLIINTMGILEILYLFVFRKGRSEGDTGNV